MFNKLSNGEIGLLIIIGISILTFLRRLHLRLKPWWGGHLKDIEKYFNEP